MNKKTSQQVYSGMAGHADRLLDDKDLLNGAFKALMLSGFLMALLVSVMEGLASRSYSSVSEIVAVGLMGTVCSCIGFGIPLVAAWGCGVAVGRNFNWFLGCPLNPSAVAALSANVAFLLLMVGVMALEGAWPYLRSNEFCITFMLVGSFLFQLTARVSVAKQIAHHNALVGHKRYTEPACHVQFRIRQLMILTFVAAIGSSILRDYLGKEMLWGLLILAGTMLIVFYPAMLCATIYQNKFGKVRLKPWEQPRPTGLESAPVESEASNEETAGPIAAPMNSVSEDLPAALQFATYRKAVDWISISGSLFGMWGIVIIRGSQIVHHGGYSKYSWSMIELLAEALGHGIAGLFFCLAVSLMFFGLGRFYAYRYRPGTLAAFTGGFVGALGTFFMLLGCEVLHYSPSSGTYEFCANNLFPLAMILYGTCAGQLMGRIGIKKQGFLTGLPEKEYQSLATSSHSDRSVWLVPMLLSTFCWCLFVALSADPTRNLIPSIDVLLFQFLTGGFGCLFAAWPIANYLARAMSVVPRRQRKFALNQLRPTSIGMRKAT